MTKLTLTHGDPGLCWLSGATLKRLGIADWKNMELLGPYPLNDAEI